MVVPIGDHAGCTCPDGRMLISRLGARFPLWRASDVLHERYTADQAPPRLQEVPNFLVFLVDNDRGVVDGCFFTSAIYHISGCIVLLDNHSLLSTVQILNTFSLLENPFLKLLAWRSRHHPGRPLLLGVGEAACDEHQGGYR